MKKVFIIHGHDSTLVKETRNYVQSMNFIPVVLIDEDDRSLTIIEKFELYASDCAFAIALLTPDDKQAEDLIPQERFRARQNVIYELGWFCGRINRCNTVLIHKGKVEMPSDLSGVLYLKIKNSIFEVTDRLRICLERIK
jgi:predicted nucleotide-binding protein